MAKPVKSSIICGLGLGKQRCQAYLFYPRWYSVQVTEPCGKVLGWEANWVSVLTDLGISLFLKDQNKHKLLRYGGEYVEKRKEPLKKGSRLISHCPVDAIQGISKALTQLVHSPWFYHSCWSRAVSHLVQSGALSARL